MSCVPLQLDTGSGDVWTVSDACKEGKSPGASCCRDGETCRTIPETAYTGSGTTFTDKYDEGSVVNDEAEAFVALGQSTFKLKFGVGIHMNDFHISSSMSGIVGLAFGSLAHRTVPTVVEQGIFKIFTMNLDLSPLEHDSFIHFEWRRR